MAKLALKESMAMAVAMLACGAFVTGAIVFYGVPSDRILGYLLAILMLLAAIMLVAIVLVALRALIRRWFLNRS